MWSVKTFNTNKNYFINSEELFSKKFTLKTQFKLLALAEKETERSITRNKKSDIDKDLQLAELKFEKLQELQCWAQEFLSDWLEECETGNLEEWLSVMEGKMAPFDDVVNKLKSVISNLGKKEDAKVKQASRKYYSRRSRRSRSWRVWEER